MLKGDNRSHQLKAHADEIVALIGETKDLPLSQLASFLDETHGVKVAKSTIWRLLDRHNMTYKKTAHTAEQWRPDVLRSRQVWFDAQIDFEPERLVFINGEALNAIGSSEEPSRGIDQDGQALWTSTAWRTLSGIRAP